MTENENNNRKSEVINPVKPENNLKTVEDLRIQHEQEKAKLIAELKQTVQTVSANIELGDKLAKTEYDKDQIEMAKKAVDKAYWRERNKTEFSEERNETEGERLSKDVYNVILKRCREGRYNGTPCQECKVVMATNK